MLVLHHKANDMHSVMIKGHEMKLCRAAKIMLKKMYYKLNKEKFKQICKMRGKNDK
jgi:hypothetical protein